MVKLWGALVCGADEAAGGLEPVKALVSAVRPQSPGRERCPRALPVGYAS